MHYPFLNYIFSLQGIDAGAQKARHRGFIPETSAGVIVVTEQALPKGSLVSTACAVVIRLLGLRILWS